MYCNFHMKLKNDITITQQKQAKYFPGLTQCYCVQCFKAVNYTIQLVLNLFVSGFLWW